MSKYKMLIDGELVAGPSEANVVNPATEATIAKVYLASQDQVDDAVQSAERAFGFWSKSPLDERRQLLVKIADVIAENTEELTQVLAQESGHTLTTAGYEVAGLADIFRYFSELNFSDRVIEESATRLAKLVHRPIGVVAAILPWNFPFGQLGAKAAPALLAGNTLVIKPAGTTPLSTLLLGKYIADIVPAGVVNIIADANDLGDYLTTHPSVRMVSFTGSTGTGKKIMANSAGTLKRLALELGGNDAAIVLDDADPKAIAEGLFWGSFYHSGQICCGIKRLYVHDSLYDQLCEELASIAKQIVIGDSVVEAEVAIGPLQNKAQFDRVQSYLKDAKTNGKIIAGGEVPDRKGFFIPPTIVRDIAEGAALVDEEQFGPVLPVIRYSDIDDAVDRANASPYGLGGSVWSSNVDRARAVAASLDVGNAWINKHADTAANLPFAGAKMSGIGAEMGEEGLSEFTQIQVINEPPAQRA